jgi:hypothetical protein
MSVSNSWGKSSSKNQSANVGLNYGTNIWEPQGGYLADLYGRAQQMSAMPVSGQEFMGSAANMYGGANSAFDQAGGLYGGSLGMLGGANQAYGQSQAALNRMANPTEADPMQAVYARNLGQQFNEQIMPGLKGEAAIGGGLGGSRAGIAQGLAGARMGQQMQDFSAQLYGQQQDRALQAGQALQGVGQGYLQGMAGVQNAAAGYGQLGSSRAGLGQNYQQLAAQQAQMPWANLQAYAGLLGPAVMRNLGGVNIGQGGGQSTAWNQSGSFSMTGM